ncbi:hypothetical protein KA977_15095 [Candidatus Dependentiae bacterium]|nr:hypothetical protein [Candidatus Dependentiae bacterium]
MTICASRCNNKELCVMILKYTVDLSLPHEERGTTLMSDKTALKSAHKLT